MPATTPLVSVPMFMNPCVTARNQGREPIRGADVVMGSYVALRFAEDEFEADPNHPLYGHNVSELSDEFYDALYNSGGYHALAYAGTAHGTSRHWHHIRLKGAGPSWELNNSANLTVRRHVWRKSVEYGPPEEPDRYTMELRFVVEHTVSPEPSLPPSGSGGQNDPDFGAWGSLFMVYVFTDEIDPDFSGTYTPAGGASPVSFTMDDPCAWGNAFGVSGGDDDDRFCHGQLAICASLPTTFQAPCGSNWVPLEERKYFTDAGGSPTARAGHRELCYTVSNGAPWSSVTCLTGKMPLDSAQGRARNVVFGVIGSSCNCAAMTTGGDVPTSVIPEYVVIENGMGVGRTYLVPTRPGWDEDCGELRVETGSSISVSLCIGDAHAPSGETWPGFEVNGCDGHPDEPFEGVGGTHRCFNNNGSAASPAIGPDICVSLDSDSIGEAVDKCVRTVTEYGPYNGSTCDVLEQRCEPAGSFERRYSLPIEDYDYVMGGNQNARVATWSRILPDPDQQFFHYTYDQADTGDLVQAVGTWSFAAGGATVDAVNAAKNVTALLLYDPSGSDYKDMKITFEMKAVLTRSHAIAARGSEASDNYTGYLLTVDAVSAGATTVSLKRYDADVETVLATRTVTGVTSDTVTGTFDVWGTTLQADLVFNPTTTPIVVSITAEDCNIWTGGKPGVASEDANAGAVIDFQIEDTTRAFLAIDGVLQQESVSISFPAQLHGIYGRCSGTYNPGCGTAPHCDCITWTYGPRTATSAGHGPDSGDIVLMTPASPTDGDNPTAYHGPSPARCDYSLCPGGEPSCGDCPPPFAALSLGLPATCAEGDQPNMASGISYYLWEAIVCT